MKPAEALLMNFRKAGPPVLIVAVLGSVGLAVLQRPRAEASSVALPVRSTPSPSISEPELGSETLPPNHPPIPASHGGGAVVADKAPPALLWDAPAGWEAVPNRSSMRIATYRPLSQPEPRGGVELSVTRAGGSTAQNIERWVAQFDAAGRDVQRERRVRGLLVTTLAVDGTYEGDMTMGGADDAHPGWGLLGAVVETKAPFYFFKLVGPLDAVRAAKPAFEALVASLRKAP